MRVRHLILLIAPLLGVAGCSKTVVTTLIFDCGDGTGVDPFYVCDGRHDCLNGADEVGCYFNWQCYNEREYVSPLVLCDGVDDCADASDEGYCDADGIYICDDAHFDVDVEVVCDGFFDCPDGSDEFYCEYTYLCENNVNAVLPQFVCDGVIDCPDQTDEIYCF